MDTNLKFERGNLMGFKTKGLLEGYIKSVLGNVVKSKYKAGDDLVGDDLIKIGYLLSRSPSHGAAIQECGIQSITLGWDKFGKYKNFVVTLNDGQVRIPSWSSCASIKPKGSSKETDVYKAFRECVDRQIFDLKEKRGKITGFEVHHAKISFTDLVDSFLKDESLTLGAVEIKDHKTGMGAAIVDRKLVNRFKKYHAKNAVLEVLTSAAHKRKHKSARKNA